MMRLNKQYKSEITHEFVPGDPFWYEKRPMPKFVYELMDHYIRLLNRNGNRPFYVFHCFYNFNKNLPRVYIRKWYMDDEGNYIGCFDGFKLGDRQLEVYTREKNGKLFARMVVSDIGPFGNGKTIEVVERRVG